MFSLICLRRPLRDLSIFGLVLLQALLPCLAAAQVGKPVDVNAPNVVGVVNSLSGAVFVRSPSDPAEVAAKPGHAISNRAIVSTGPSGEVILLFADGLHVTLGGNTVLHVDEYRFDAGNSNANRAVFTLTAGALRLVTGAMHAVNRDALIVRGGEAEVSVISKEVTAFVVHVETRPEVEVNIAVIIGQVSIRTSGGSPDNLAQGQFARWRRGAGPVLAQPLEAAPAVLQALARSPALAQDATMDAKVAAELAKFLGSLPAPAAGETTTAEPRVALAEFILPVVTPGGGGGCVGSPC